MIAALRRRAREQAENAAPRDDARELTRLIGDCTAAGIQRSALTMRLSELPQGRALPHHIRLARAALEPLISADRARVFALDNHDLIVVWRGDATAAVKLCRRAIDHLFTEDTAYGGHGAPPENFVQLLALPEDARDLLAIIEASLTEAPAPPPAGPQEEDPPLDLHQIGLLETALQQADLARFARRRAVCTLNEDGAFDLTWEKRFLSIEELAEALVPDRSARADAWLFRRLTRTLDRRMLSLLSHPEELRQAPAFSLNLNIASIIGPEFLRFDEFLPARLRGQVILELLPADVMTDPAAFQFAREFARVRNYPLLLRGLTPILLRMFSREATGVEWLQLRWRPDLIGRSDALGDVDPSHVVLAHADSGAAIAWGRAQGITHFRGASVQVI